MTTEDTFAEVQQTIPGDDISNEPARQELAAGCLVGRFVIISKLGKGGMGVVYKAYDPELDRRIAIKLMNFLPEQGDSVGVRRDRFVREAQALAKLNHPNVVSVHDVGAFGNGVYIAMEYVEGKTLRTWIKEKRTYQEVLEVYLAAGRGLQAAHAQGIIHRDFKPENGMVDENGRVWILDFGLAKSVHQNTQEQKIEESSALETPSEQSLLEVHLTTEDSFVGTALYMAPEQLFGQAVTQRSDQFSFCVALFEALYGKRPFAGKTLFLLKKNIMRNNLRYPEQADVPKWIVEVLVRGLSKAPNDRYASMADLMQGLKHDPNSEKKTKQKKQIRAAVFVLLAALPFGLWYLLFQQAQVCDGAQQKLHGMWGEERKSQVMRSFAKTKLSYSSDNFSRVDKHLDQYLGSWAEEYTQTCRATRIRQEQSEELMDLRMRCLDRLRKSAKAIVEIFANADKTVVASSVQAVTSLSSLANCRDVEALRSRILSPENQIEKAKVEKIRDVLTRVEALHKAGKVQDGLGLAQLAWSKAQHSVYAKKRLAQTERFLEKHQEQG